ncbi:hypothetical protein [Bordetella genomosp. 4]|uniref:DUF1440 domain-containing protein n=1 Tax=Bordetella genomosp. 4 TaxID=463044 RepID=A0A261TRU8_9BORD|nr:hypothetical protein [Bordetella genomosp. 4]OZI52349.1 hypothetical protein CAL20_20560 [Bordetella genomosp. 4]
MSSWRTSLAEGLRAGTAASVVSTAVLIAGGRAHTGHAFSATNATSHWVWGRPALYVNAPSMRHTAIGYIVHHGASIFWAALHAQATAHKPNADSPRAVMTSAMVTSAVACLVDFWLTPARLTPGFEHRLPRATIGVVYLAFGLAMGIGALCWRRSAKHRTKKAAR